MPTQRKYDPFTPARRAQLEELKRKRHAARAMSEAEPPPIVTYRQFLAEIQRIAMGGIAPTMERFNYAKPSRWDTAQVYCERFGVTWADVADEAGLKMKHVALEPQP